MTDTTIELAAATPDQSPARKFPRRQMRMNLRKQVILAPAERDRRERATQAEIAAFIANRGVEQCKPGVALGAYDYTAIGEEI